LDADNSYRDDNAQAILKARKEAQVQLYKQFVPQSPFSQSASTKLLPFVSGQQSLISKKSTISKVVNFLQSYTIHESLKTANALRDLALGTNEGRVMAARMLVSVQVSNLVYMAGMSIMAEAFRQLGDDDDEPWDEEVYKILTAWTDDIAALMVGNNISLLVGRYGALFRSMLALTMGAAKTLAKDSEVEAIIEQMSKYASEGLYVEPVNQKSTGEKWMRLIPAVGSTSADLLKGTDSALRLANKAASGDDLTDAKKDQILAMQLMVTALSLAIPNPVTPTIDKYLRGKRGAVLQKEREDKAQKEGAKATLDVGGDKYFNEQKRKFLKAASSGNEEKAKTAYDAMGGQLTLDEDGNPKALSKLIESIADDKVASFKVRFCDKNQSTPRANGVLPSRCKSSVVIRLSLTAASMATRNRC